jgi:hypothetical protein
VARHETGRGIQSKRPVQTLKSEAKTTFKRLQMQVESEIRQRFAHTTANLYHSWETNKLFLAKD